METYYDLIIVGSGLVGVSVIAALKKSNLNIAVLETYLPEMQDARADARPIALNYISQQILTNLEIWPKLTEFAQPIQTVHVSQENHFGFLEFRAGEEHVPALGYVVPIHELQNALYQAAQTSGVVKYIPIQKLLHIKQAGTKDPALTQVIAQTIDGEKKFTADLLVIADGAKSPARELLGIDVVIQASGDVAFTFTAELSQPHQACAYERFTQNGVIAVLPLKNPRHCRIVWTLTKELADDVSQWPEEQLNQYFYTSFRGRLGRIRIQEQGKVLPLQAVFANEQIRPGVVLMGNAAHSLYPLAAQGFNLALRDVASLVEVLFAARQNHRAIGDLSTLEEYLQLRGEDQRWVSQFVNSAGTFFGLQIPGLGTMRGLGLMATGLIPPLKHRLASRLLGKSGKIPKLARGIAL